MRNLLFNLRQLKPYWKQGLTSLSFYISTNKGGTIETSLAKIVSGGELFAYYISDEIDLHEGTTRWNDYPFDEVDTGVSGCGAGHCF